MSGIEGVCFIGVGGCRCGVDGNIRVSFAARARSSGEEILEEGGSGGGEKVVPDRGVYDAFWSRREYNVGVGDTGDG